eukprot:SAG31_NODE_5805_length_2320_cov_0.807294_1_plen_209_part_00
MLPGKIIQSIEGVLNQTDSGVAADVQVYKEMISESKHHRDLVQENNGKRVSPNKEDWKCDKTGDTLGEGPGKTASLWMNLSNGFVGGGRRYVDGSGGNNTALDHYQEMKAQGKEYPLAVKLGTINADGADIYSYAEDDAVSIPIERLAELLRHWDIDIMAMKKTEKDTKEMELEMNKNWDFGKVGSLLPLFESMERIICIGWHSLVTA